MIFSRLLTSDYIHTYTSNSYDHYTYMHTTAQDISYVLAYTTYIHLHVHTGYSTNMHKSKVSVNFIILYVYKTQQYNIRVHNPTM